MSTSDAGLAPPAWQELRTELVRFVLARVADDAAADDIVHDVLLRALRELAGPEPPVHLRGWLYRVTRNAIVDHYRTRRPTEELPTEFGPGPSDEDASAEQELAHCLAPLLRTLAPDYRDALALAEVEGLTQREIADRAGLTLSGAKSRVQRARKMLRKAILACCRVELDRRGGVVGYQRRAGCDPCGSSDEPTCGTDG